MTRNMIAYMKQAEREEAVRNEGFAQTFLSEIAKGGSVHSCSCGALPKAYRRGLRYCLACTACDAANCTEELENAREAVKAWNTKNRAGKVYRVTGNGFTDPETKETFHEELSEDGVIRIKK